MTATFSADFKHEFEQERSSWLRRRILWYAGSIAALRALTYLTIIIPLLRSSGTDGVLVFLEHVIQLIVIGMFVSTFMFVYRSGLQLTHRTMIHLIYALLILSAILLFMGVLIMSSITEGFSAQNNTLSGQWLGGITAIYFLTSLFIPWTPREAIRPVVAIFGGYALVMVLSYVFTDMNVWFGLIQIVAFPVLMSPGIGIAWWRHSRFKDRFHYKALRGRYGQMKRELVDARRLHESLFPRPIETGSVRFSYSYEPMRQIGGDFLFTHTFPTLGVDDDNEPVSVVLVDVTGHGIPAALTVNRLHGELERIFGEDPDIGPGEVLRMLNRYVHLTLSRHSVYATALCLRVDPRSNRLLWASGGHPPAFLRGVDGTLTELGSTALVLGAVTGSDFDPGEESHQFMRGDGLIAYTDGAIESKNAKGQMLRIEGLRAILATVVPDPGMDGWAGAILREIDMFRHGPAEDDTLVVELFRPLVSVGSSEKRADQSQLGEPTSIADKS